jgi:glycosyltransferase involved in cell wall biosynthesis
MPDLTDRWVQPALRWALTQPRWDAVLSSAGPYTAHLVALALRTRGQVGRWIADYRDLWSDHPSVTGLFPFTLREAALERRCLAHVDALTTVSQGLQQRLAQRTRAPVHIVYNGYEPDVPVEAPPEPPAPPGPKLIELVYTGTLYPTGQDPEPLLRACASLRDKSPELASRLRITVAGLSTALWVRTAGALGMPELIHPLGTLPWAQSLGLQRRATALVLLDWHDPAAGVLTGKVFEYLAAEAPVLCIGGGPGSPAAALLQETSRGVILGQDIPSITQALLSLLRGEDLGLRRRDDLISEYTRKSQSLKCLGILTSQTDPPQPPAA